MTATDLAAPTRWFDRRMGWDARRVIGLDVARGLAMIGMFGAHLNVTRKVTVADPSTYLSLVHGRSAVLFALLAGVSLAIVTGGATPRTGQAMVDFRLRTLVRAVLLFVLGGLLVVLDTPVAVILEAYAALFAMSLIVLGWSAKRLWITVGVLAVLGPVVTFTARFGLYWLGNPPVGALSIAFGQFYPVMTWIAFPVAGIAIGRMDLRAVRTAVTLVVGGTVAAVVGYYTGFLAQQGALAAGLSKPTLHPPDGVLASPLEVFAALPRGVFAAMLTAEPHSGTPFEVVGSGGFAIAVLGLCLLVARTPVRYALAPVAAVGALSLTVYTAHIVAIRCILGDLYVDPTSLAYFGGFTVVALVAATTWRLAFGKGPLERLLSWVAARASSYAGRSERPSRTAEPGSSSTSS